ncbi:hypothetical protein E7T06_04145 [Deinococcus sp. Arct2-2]|uniref:hypothetical protein n=1 Tax=Deinococcus sp. Arct2-2 TaxID=2568653 RepID=UPI0010A2AA80|nr:hypothetical protein [Deinococcus sp. Arct2-2]THF71260.1 hypothetical protein E7T06_04145 [Deinococcus sp. Arct2-2]
MELTGSWTDIYGSVRARFEGRVGGQVWLIAAPADQAAAVPDALQAVDGKGRAEFLVHQGVTPLLSAIAEQNPYGVLVVAEQDLSGGPAVSVSEQEIETDGLSYREGGSLPAWVSALQSSAEHGVNEAASAAASAGIPVVVVSAVDLAKTLEAWMDGTPHGR